jgi:hypothetical protein
MDKL